MPRSSLLWPGIIAVSALAAGLVVFARLETPFRPWIVFWFLFVCPGMAFVRLLRLQDRVAEWTLAFALSIALDAIVAASLLYARAWSPDWGLVILIAISLGGAALQVVQAMVLTHRTGQPAGGLDG
jgi:hypothetical protein